MNKLLPYEEELLQQLDNIQLPDENLAWEDMKRRLKKEDDDKVLQPFWLRGCALWSLLLLLLVGLGWGTYTYVKTKRENIVTSTSKDYKLNTTSKKDTIINEEKTTNTTSLLPTSSNPIIVAQNDSNEVASNKNRVTQKAAVKIKIGTPQMFTDIDENKATSEKQQKGRVTYSKIKSNKEGFRNRKSKNRIVNEDESFEDENASITNKGKSKVKVFSPALQMDSANESDAKKEPSFKKMSDTLVKKENKQADTSKKATTEKAKKKSKYTFITGLGEQQIIPIDGQRLTPYNSLGRKGTLLDYIPSIYVRVKRNEKWFVQAEFKYGAPQYNKDNFVYQQKIVPDTGFNPPFSTITSSKLKKSYYHQLPITFNYYVAPNWSVGAGVQWNNFFGVVAEKEINRKNNFTQRDSIISSFTAIDKKDSANLFKKNYFLGVIETQYQWKRLTFGAKYTFGLEPYITFTLPGGNQQKERSNSVLLFIKYELWKSKNKK